MSFIIGSARLYDFLRIMKLKWIAINKTVFKMAQNELHASFGSLKSIPFSLSSFSLCETGLSCLFTHKEPRNDLQLTSKQL